MKIWNFRTVSSLFAICCRKSVNDTVNPKEVLNSQVKETGAEIPMEDTKAIEKIEDGYHIKSKKFRM